MKYLAASAAIAALSLSPIAQADLNYFLVGKYGSLVVDDPDGNVDDTTDFSWEVKVSFDLSTRGNRTFATFGTINADIDAGVNQISQEIEGYRVGFGYERNIPVTSVFDVWLGATLNYSEIDFSNRNTIDSDGFLVSNLGDREFSGIGAGFHVDTYIELSDTFNLGVGGYYDFAIESDGVESYGVRFTLGSNF